MFRNSAGNDVDRVLELALTIGQTVGRPLMGDDALACLDKELKRRLRPARRCRPKMRGSGNTNR
ncbi:MAG: hypothetical protein GY807_03195 [Gammaproteobacteria bacterium]|nr:hypothetical protein [Gammaproteobacteria bacterium]